MKLLLTWLVGVPALVAAMVLARANLADVMQSSSRLPSQATLQASCSGQANFHHVAGTVATDRNGVACNRVTVQ
jgi:hypothetical protein